MNKTLQVIMSIVFIVVMTSAFHEGVHLAQMKHDKAQIKEICVVGFMDDATGWVKYYDMNVNDYDHETIDYILTGLFAFILTTIIFKQVFYIPDD